ncbi:MAG: hypothetical protein S4CHLAM20_03210 [Chlamydiia bacterium]|nr:hypothetical protein [Chlamydiia bacterium]
MSTIKTDELTKYIKTVYTADNVIPLGSRVCDPKNNAKAHLKKISTDLKRLLEENDPKKIEEWMKKTIRQIDGPDLNETINKITGA